MVRANRRAAAGNGKGGLSGVSRKTLAAGLGNVLLGEEGIGVHAVRALLEGGVPEGVDIVDAGTALGDLLGELSGYGRLILVDAVRGGGQPGGLYRMEIESPEELSGARRPLPLHEMGVAEALDQARALPRLAALVHAEAFAGGDREMRK